MKNLKNILSKKSNSASAAKVGKIKAPSGQLLGKNNKWLIIGLSVVILSLSALVPYLLLKSNAISVVVDNSVPNPTNIKSYVDDQIATITWDEPTNAAAQGIVGYYVTWGTQSSSKYSYAKQTIYTTAQIQPLTNGTPYNVKVQSIIGNAIDVPTPGAHDGETAKEFRASGRVSSGIMTTATASSARVDQLRTQMTGFFDDFSQPSGAFDELKWNTATSACVMAGTAGSFVNAQFHAHSEIRSSCDRAQIVNRPRGVFDISGKTISNPGIMVFDFDGTGATRGRDAWYIDLIPTNARTDGSPLDITSHASIFDDMPADPAMIRLEQQHDVVKLIYYDDQKLPHNIIPTFILCEFQPGAYTLDYCDTVGKATAGLSPLPEQPFDQVGHRINIANVRQHWRMEVTTTSIKVFVNSTLILAGPMPSNFTSITKYNVHNNLFSYNTGKQTPEDNPTVSMLHWDNFGFNGPAPSTVVHNYLEGGATGTIPYLGVGSVANPIPGGPRSTKINIPDLIASPTQARFMFTLQNFGYQSYTWKSSDKVTINGHDYAMPNPAITSRPPLITLDGTTSTSSGIVPYATSILVNPSDLRQGINDIIMAIDSDIMNVHLELEYLNGTQPNYTQPKNIFSTASLLAAIDPPMAAHDMYLFVEQTMGLPTGCINPSGCGDVPAATPTPPVISTTPSPTLAPTAFPTTTPTPAPTAFPTPLPTQSPTPTTTIGTILLTYPGHATPAPNAIVADVRQLAIKPVVPVGYTVTAVSITNSLTGSTTATALDASGNVMTPNKNGNYTVTVTAKSGATIITTSTSVRVRHPDINRDGKVGTADIATIFSKWLSNYPEYDINDNGKVDNYDLFYIYSKWGS